MFQKLFCCMASLKHQLLFPAPCFSISRAHNYENFRFPIFWIVKFRKIQFSSTKLQCDSDKRHIIWNFILWTWIWYQNFLIRSHLGCTQNSWLLVVKISLIWPQLTPRWRHQAETFLVAIFNQDESIFRHNSKKILPLGHP